MKIVTTKCDTRDISYNLHEGRTLSQHPDTLDVRVDHQAAVLWVGVLLAVYAKPRYSAFCVPTRSHLYGGGGEGKRRSNARSHRFKRCPQ